MKRIRVIPVLQVQNGGLVKTIKFKKPQYIGDPVNAVKIFNEKEVDELVLLDIEATKLNKEPNFYLIEEVASECFMPLAYGGGIKNIKQVKKIIGLGVEKVILNTAAYTNPKLINEIAEIYGSQCAVVAIDVKKNIFGNYQACIYSGKKKIKEAVIDYAKRLERLGAGEIILSSIDRDGTFRGYDFELIKKVSQEVQIPLVANGGAFDTDNFYKAVVSGASAGSAGSMFVFKSENRGVLINYPSQKELEKSVFEKLS